MARDENRIRRERICKAGEKPFTLLPLQCNITVPGFVLVLPGKYSIFPGGKSRGKEREA